MGEVRFSVNVYALAEDRLGRYRRRYTVPDAGHRPTSPAVSLVGPCRKDARRRTLIDDVPLGAGEYITRMSLARTLCEAVEAAGEELDTHEVLRHILGTEFHSTFVPQSSLQLPPP